MNFHELLRTVRDLFIVYVCCLVQNLLLGLVANVRTLGSYIVGGCVTASFEPGRLIDLSPLRLKCFCFLINLSLLIGKDTQRLNL